ncbi:MAG: putative membrane protein [Planctomycetota bacterium]|jgi:putative membrane protein
MIAASFIAFAHFVAFFALAAALVIVLVLISGNFSVEIAMRIQRADRAAGIAALALFAGVFVLTIYPTSRFIGWSPDLAAGKAPSLTLEEVRKIKRSIHWQLILIAGMILCASLMAKGAGF